MTLKRPYNESVGFRVARIESLNLYLLFDFLTSAHTLLLLLLTSTGTLFQENFSLRYKLTQDS
jgi:hypothetical protein